MSEENQTVDSHEEQMKKILLFTQKQQDKAGELISDAKKNIANFTPLDQENDFNTQTEVLMKSVNDELDKAMEEVNRQMELITTQ